MSSKKINLLRQYFPDAIVGGTGYDKNIKAKRIIRDGGNKYENYDYFINPDFSHSIGFTQRGCRLRCPFCVVPQKEGKNQMVNSIYDIYRGEPYPRKIHLLDNDFFGQEAWRQRAEEIIDGDFRVSFNQGINVRLIHKEGAKYLSQMKYYDDQFKQRRIYTAWDNRRDENIFMRGINIMLDAGIKPHHIMVYMLCGYWKTETFDDIYYRFEKMTSMGLKPYPMVYDKPNASIKIKRFQRWVLKLYHEMMSFDEYEKLCSPGTITANFRKAKNSQKIPGQTILF